MLDAQTWAGVSSLLDKYAKLQIDDFVIIAFTPDALEPAAWLSAALSIRGVHFCRIAMQPLRDRMFGKAISDAILQGSRHSGNIILFTLERETMSHDNEIREALCLIPDNKCKVFRAISTCNRLFSHALQMSPEDISSANTALLEQIMDATDIRVTTKSGSDLKISIDSSKYKWISNRGHWRPGKFVILPAGEVATYPNKIDGVLVADFAFNVNAMTSENAALQGNPVEIFIDDGIVTHYNCRDKFITNFLDQCFFKYCAKHVGELGFGTNYAIKEPISLNSHINERHPGVHIGFGQHNQGSSVGYRCNVHLDLIADGGELFIDQSGNMIDLTVPMSSTASHPDNYRDEDVFAPDFDDIDVDDCCGILGRDGLELFVD